MHSLPRNIRCLRNININSRPRSRPIARARARARTRIHLRLDLPRPNRLRTRTLPPPLRHAHETAPYALLLLLRAPHDQPWNILTIIPSPSRAAEFPPHATAFERDLHAVADLLRGGAKSGVLRHHALAQAQELRDAAENGFRAPCAFGAQVGEPGVEAGGVEGVEGGVGAGFLSAGARRAAAAVGAGAGAVDGEVGAGEGGGGGGGVGALRAVFDEVGRFAAEKEGEEVEVDAGEGEDVRHFGRGGGEVAEGGWVERGRFGQHAGGDGAGG